MAGISIHLPEGEMEAALSAALLSSLSTETRASIIGQAIAYLNKPERVGSSYGYNSREVTPLQSAFETAMGAMLHRVTREFIENDAETRELIDGELRTLVGDLRGQLVGENAAGMREAFVGAMISRLADERAARD